MQEEVVGALRNKLREGRQNLGSCVRNASGIYVVMMMKLRWEGYMTCKGYRR